MKKHGAWRRGRPSLEGDSILFHSGVGTIGVWGLVTLLWERPVHWGMFSSSPGLPLLYVPVPFPGLCLHIPPPQPWPTLNPVLAQKGSTDFFPPSLQNTDCLGDCSI